MNWRGVISGLGIDVHFRLLERLFVSGPINEDNETDDVGMFIAGVHRTLDEGEKQMAEIIKQQLIYDIAVELSTICDGVSANSSLRDEQVQYLMLVYIVL
jgi:hypothetical protein